MDAICDDLTLYDHMSRTSSAQSEVYDQEAYDQEACDQMSRTCSADLEAHDHKSHSYSDESEAHDRMPCTSSAQSEESTSSVLSVKSFAKHIKDAGSKLVATYFEEVEKYADNYPDFGVYW